MLNPEANDKTTSSAESPEQLPLVALMVLVARLVALPIFRRVSPTSLEGETFRRFCAGLECAQGYRSVSGDVGQAEIVAPLFRFLRDRLTVASAHVADLPRKEQASLVSSLEALRQAISSFACKTCAGPRGHQCDGIDEKRDDEQIDSRGLCLGLVREMRDHVAARMDRAVTRWGAVQETDQSVPAYRWATQWVGGPRWQLPTAQWKADAATRFLDEGNFRVAEVALTLAVEEIDWDSLLVIPWLFTHEFVCHVSQAAPMSGQARKECRRFCPFFEGWMDEVSYKIFEADMVSGWLGRTRSTFLNAHREAFVQAASDFRRERYGTGPATNRRLLAAQWNLGAEAARTLLRFFESASPQDEEETVRRVALSQLLTLSFRIQRATATPHDLDRVVSGCLLAGSVGLTADDLNARASLLNLLTEPITAFSTWIEELEEFCSSAGTQTSETYHSADETSRAYGEVRP